MCESGICFSFAAHSEPFESQGARAAKRYVKGNLVEREKHHLNLHLNLGVGCAPSGWPIFRIPNLLGARRGAEGSFLCSLITDFLAEGGGWGGSPGRGGGVGGQARGGFKKFVRGGARFLAYSPGYF